MQAVTLFVLLQHNDTLTSSLHTLLSLESCVASCSLLLWPLILFFPHPSNQTWAFKPGPSSIISLRYLYFHIFLDLLEWGKPKRNFIKFQHKIHIMRYFQLIVASKSTCTNVCSLRSKLYGKLNIWMIQKCEWKYNQILVCHQYTSQFDLVFPLVLESSWNLMFKI